MLSFTILSDPTRRRIVEMLAQRDRTAGEIVAEFQVSAPAISQHLKVLREAGFIRVRVDKQKRIQSLNPAALREVEDWARQTREFWERRLDTLERELLREDSENTQKQNDKAVTQGDNDNDNDDDQHLDNQ